MVKKSGTRALPAPPGATGKKERKGKKSRRHPNRRQDSSASDGEGEGEQHDDTRIEEEENSEHEEQEEGREEGAQSHSEDEDAMSPDSSRRHQNAGQTPAPEHESPAPEHGSPGDTWSSSGWYHNASQTPAPEHESPVKTKKMPMINYRVELQGPRGDISLTCNCETRHLKICKQDTSCRCRWAKRFHTDECNEKYTSARAASQRDTSEDEDEEPDDQYCMTPGMKQTSPRTDKRSPPDKEPPRGNKRARDSMTETMPTVHEQGAGRGATAGTAATAHSDDKIGAIVGILQGTVNEMKADRMAMTSARNKNKYKDVANKIQQVTAANEKDLKVVAQLYHKAEGEGQILAG